MGRKQEGIEWREWRVYSQQCSARQDGCISASSVNIYVKGLVRSDIFILYICGMAIIDGNIKFLGISPEVDTTERKSTKVNSLTEIYTFNDINNTLLSGVGFATVYSDDVLSAGESSELKLSTGEFPKVTKEDVLWSIKVSSAVFVSEAPGPTLVVGDSYINEVNILVKKVGGVLSIVGLNGGNSIYDTNMQNATFTFAVSGTEDFVITFNAPSTASGDTFKCVSNIKSLEISF